MCCFNNDLCLRLFFYNAFFFSTGLNIFFLYLFLDSAIYFIITYLTVEMLSPISWAISLNFLNAMGLLFDYITLNLISIIYLSRSWRSSYLF